MPDHGRQDASREVASAVRAVKELVTILTGLALTNTVVLLLTRGDYSRVADLADLPVISMLFSAAIVVTILHFHLSNTRHMDATYGATGSSYRQASLGVDSVCVILQSGILALMSFYVNRPHTALLIFGSLLVSDSLWTVIGFRGAPSYLTSLQIIWLLPWAVTGLLLAFALMGGHGAVSLYVGAAAMFLHNAFDVIYGWTFLFPTQSEGRMTLG
jgi:hypothetical protein